jgi:hypothetical protein
MADELPYAWGVLYAPPNLDGSRKKCFNCALFIEATNRCMIHSENVEVLPGMVCGYHVFGMPDTMNPLVVQSPIDPKLSGLEDVSDLDGTNCGTCVYFERTASTAPGKGVCHGVAKANGRPPQPVQEMGCCARWERSEED